MHYILKILLIVPLITTGKLNCRAKPFIGRSVKEADLHDFTSVVSIGLRDDANCAEINHICTGVLISKEHVLTASHCFEGLLWGEIRITLGSNDLREGVHYYPNMLITYERWANENEKSIQFSDNDIAIIKLNEEVSLRGIKPAKLSRAKNSDLWDSDAIMAGWGVTEFNQTRPSRTLKKAEIRIRKLNKCELEIRQITGQSILIPEQFLCSFAFPHTLIGCGDSGGPLLDKSNSVVAINRGTCPPIEGSEHPMEFLYNHMINLHVGLDFYRDFIEDVLKRY